jgi:hypothetical protein
LTVNSVTKPYGRLTPTYYQRSHAAQKEDHVGMPGRASVADCGNFRVVRRRDRNHLDFDAFKKTSHYQRFYRDAGIADRITISFPLTADHESFSMIDRYQTKPRRRLFNLCEATLAGRAILGAPQLHRRLFLGNGFLMADKPLRPTKRQILTALLTGMTEKQIAAMTE